MKILILTANSETISTKKLLAAGKRFKHQVKVYDPRNLQISLTANQIDILDSKGKSLKADIVIPRLGSISFDAGLKILEAFKSQGAKILNTPDAILKTADKLRSLLILKKAGLPVPESTYIDTSRDFNISQIKDESVIIKLIRGAQQGYGVSLIARKDLTPLLQTLRSAKTKVFLQKFIKEARGEDYRFIVLNDEVIATMKRKAKPGDFRSNLAQGGKSSPHKPTEAEINLAISATKAMGLDFAGVDLIKSKKQMLVLEINAFPGLGGIEKISKANIASQIIQSLID